MTDSLKFIRLPDFKKSPVFNFISKRSGPYEGSVKLTRDRVYIVPTKAGLLFALLLIILLIGSINYEKNLGFILTFLLAGIGNIALLSTWRNIAGIELKGMQSSSVFAGEQATFSVQITNDKLLDRHSLIISHLGKDHDVVDCASRSKVQMSFNVNTDKRGIINPGKFRIYSEFPMGLFVGWTWVDLMMTCLIYPQPSQGIEQISSDDDNEGDSESTKNGQENFSQLRKYHHGDNINHISWKALARTGELYSKEFNGSSPVVNWISWDDIPAKNNEHRLSIMTAIIIEADKRNEIYGLKLPTEVIQPDTGKKHYHQCLTALALF